MADRILGTDISRYQGNIDFAKAKGNGIVFAIFKAGEVINNGQTEWTDTKYARNIVEGKAHGLITGAYYFFHPAVGASQQARHFKSILDQYGYPDMPLAIDVEVNDNKSAAHCAAVLKAMIDQLEQETGRKIMIYTRANIWISQYGNPSWTKDYPLWLAQYPLIDPITNPSTYSGKMNSTTASLNPAIWQFTERMQLPGLPNMDGNFWLGTMEELETFADESYGTEPPEPQPKRVRITANFLRFRPEPVYRVAPTLIVEKTQELDVAGDSIYEPASGITWLPVHYPDGYAEGIAYISANPNYITEV